MAEKTGIAWCDSTFNPWLGCTKIGDGCTNCYAEVQDSRKRWDGGKTHWGAAVPRYRTSASNWAQPISWNKKAAASRKPRRVFCASLADVFDNEVPCEWRTDLWNLVVATPNLSWLLVTKRISNARRMVPIRWWHGEAFPPNVRLLITVCNQEEADRDIPKLLALPCKNGISYEPALGPIEWNTWPNRQWLRVVGADGAAVRGKIEWIIVGGESGPKARPFDVGWARSTIEQCKAAGVPVFIKQLGARPFCEPSVAAMAHVSGSEASSLTDRAGADPDEWPEDMRVREFP